MAVAAVGLAPARAAEYTVADETELRDAIDTIIAGSDPDPVIILENDIAVSDTSFPALNKPVTIDTNGNVLSGIDIATGTTPGTAITFDPADAGGALTIVGDLEGGDAAPDAGDTRGGTGFSGEAKTVTVTGGSTVTGGAGGGHSTDPAGIGGTGLELTDGTLLNNGTITGGAGGVSDDNSDGSGGAGARLIGGTDHVNNGVIRGGTSHESNFAAGLWLIDGTLVNNGLIEGGSVAPTGSGSATNADGVYLDGGTLINNSDGIIRGGSGSPGGRRGDGITFPFFRDGGTIINHGLIEGGDEEFAIVKANDGDVTIVNSGTIRGHGRGPGTDVAISLTLGQSVVELHGGSTIIGNVDANENADDTLRLGGDDDDSFDVGAIGPDQQYQDFDIFEKTGASTWTITGEGTNQVAPWDIYEGTMLMSAGSDLGDGAVDVFGGTLAGVGTVGPTTLHEDGAIAPGTDGTGTLTIDGNYTGNGGTLLTETVLGGDASDTDLLFIEGDTTLGTAPTQVSVTNLGGSGAQTNEGIRIVQVEGASAPGLFELNGDTVVNGNEAVLAGAYAYSLYQGSVSDPLDGDWYLRSFGFSPTAAVYEAYPSAMLGMVELPTLQQRVGDRRYFGATGGGAGPAIVKGQANESTGYSGGRNLWVRIEGAHRHQQGDSTTGTQHDSNRYLVQLGLDGMITDADSGVVIGGINAQYAHLDADISSGAGDGDVAADSFGLGATLTWYGDGGGYLDVQGLGAYQTGDVSSDAVGKLVDGNEGWGYAVGVEAGRKIGLEGNWGVTPQAQLSYTSVGFDDFTDPFGAEVSLDSADSLKGRIGLAVNYDAFDGGAGSRKHVYAIANLTHEFLDGTSVDVSGTELAFDPEDFGGELGIGGTYEWGGGRYAVHGEALGQTDFSDGYGVKGTAGAEVRF